MKSTSIKQLTSKPIIAIGALAVIGMVGFTGFSAWQANAQADQTSQAIGDLTKVVSSLAEQQQKNSFGSKEEFQSAVAKSIQAYEQEVKDAERDELYASFDNAGDEPINGKWIYGSKNARFTLVEYSDYECPYCKRFHDTPKKIVDGSKENVNWEFKHFPLPFHNPAAEKEAIAAECIADQLGNKAFWVASNEIFRTSQGNGGGVADMKGMAERLGADPKVFSECLSSGRFDKKLAEHQSQGQKLGVNGTPATFIVDNQTGKSQMISGAQPPEAIISIIRRMMQPEATEKNAG